MCCNKIILLQGTLDACCAGQNENLDFLDLSWNHLRPTGGVAVAKGLKVWQTPFLCFYPERSGKLFFFVFTQNGLANSFSLFLPTMFLHSFSLFSFRTVWQPFFHCFHSERSGKLFFFVFTEDFYVFLFSWVFIVVTDIGGGGCVCVCVCVCACMHVCV